MRAIIIAAGLGSRLGNQTKIQPKCLLPVGNKNILDYQIEALQKNNISDFYLIKGHCAEEFTKYNYPSFFNGNFQNNNILASLMYAESLFDQAFIASYSDILYSPAVVKKLLQSTADISLIVDIEWQQKYQGRTEHPIEEAELVVFDQNYKITQLGKNLKPSSAQSSGEFIGLFKFSNTGAQLLKKHYHEAQKRFAHRSFYKAKEFQKAYITDMMMYFIDQGIEVNCIPIQKQWWEIDTNQDLERARDWIKTENWA